RPSAGSSSPSSPPRRAARASASPSPNRSSSNTAAGWSARARPHGAPPSASSFPPEGGGLPGSSVPGRSGIERTEKGPEGPELGVGHDRGEGRHLGHRGPRGHAVRSHALPHQCLELLEGPAPEPVIVGREIGSGGPSRGALHDRSSLESGAVAAGAYLRDVP